MRKISILGISALGAMTFVTSCKPREEKKPYNVLFIAIDDMNNWVGAMGGQAKTPNIDQLASDGVLFSNAFCAVPACNPSRTALMTGLRPETTGQYGKGVNFRERPGGKDAIMLAQFLQSKGYETVAAGKIFHHPRGAGKNPSPLSDTVSWNYQWVGNVGTQGAKEYVNEEGWGKWHDGDIKKLIPPGTQKNTGLEYIGKHGIWGPIKETKEETGDWQLSEFCKEYLSKDHNKPFFLACGIFRPHSPQLAPKEYFDLYPLDSIEMPELPADDMDDIPAIAKENWSTPFVHLVKEKHQLRNAVQAYLACMSYADDCVGNVYNALKNSKYADNTIVVFWTDHGWQLGHKDRWEKFSLWKQATNAPLVIKYPGMKSASQECKNAVSFMDIYPTVLNILNFEQPEYLQGKSIKKLIDDPTSDWEYPAVITYPGGNHSIEFKEWNYIHYIDGSEELYNHNNDPKEFHNLASDPQYRVIMDSLKKWIPESTALISAED